MGVYDPIVHKRVHRSGGNWKTARWHVRRRGLAPWMIDEHRNALFQSEAVSALADHALIEKGQFRAVFRAGQQGLHLMVTHRHISSVRVLGDSATKSSLALEQKGIEGKRESAAQTGHLEAGVFDCGW